MADIPPPPGLFEQLRDEEGNLISEMTDINIEDVKEKTPVVNVDIDEILKWMNRVVVVMMGRSEFSEAEFEDTKLRMFIEKLGQREPSWWIKIAELLKNQIKLLEMKDKGDKDPRWRKIIEELQAIQVDFNLDKI